MSVAQLLLYNELREQIRACSICWGVGKVLLGYDLVMCECLRQALCTFYLAASNIPAKFKSYELKDYMYPESPTFAKVLKYVEALEKATKKGHGLYLYGGPQSGRTFLACGVLKEAARRGFSVYFQTYGSLLSLMHHDDSDPRKSEVRRITSSGDIDLVCIDNVSEVLEKLTNMKTTVLSGQPTHGAVGFLENIISARALESKPLLITGSVSMEEIGKRFESLGTLMTSQFLEAKCDNHHQVVKHQQRKRLEDIGWDQLGA